MKANVKNVMAERVQPKVAIIDFHMGNMFSVQHACRHVGLDSFITSDRNELKGANAAILPGVGAFGVAMENLSRMDLISAIKDFIASGKPFLGICLGMQLLFDTSEEFGLHEGLNIIPGNVVKFRCDDSERTRIKVPHMGWNRISRPEQNGSNLWDASPLRGIRQGEFMYFVHSYYVVPSNDAVIVSLTYYEGIRFCSSVQYQNVFATQYHPEKSAGEGIRIYENWSRLIKGI